MNRFVKVIFRHVKPTVFNSKEVESILYPEALIKSKDEFQEIHVKLRNGQEWIFPDVKVIVSEVV